MFLLRTFGGLSIRSDGDSLPSAATQRRRLALLALLAAAGERGLTRDKLMAVLWPESAPDKARHALEQLLYATRRDLGRNAIRTAGGMVAVDDEVLGSDVADFERALAAADWERAVARYGGPFLEGVYLDGSPEWERWAEGERDRLARLYATALERLAEARAGAGDRTGAVEAWRQLAAHDPYSSRIALRLMQTLDTAGDRAGAIQHARVHAALLRQEFETEPDPDVEDLAERLRREPAAPASAPPATAQELGAGAMLLSPTTHAPGSEVSPPNQAELDTSLPHPVVHPTPAVVRRRFLSRRAAAVLALTLLPLAAVGGWAVSRDDHAPTASGTPASVAVLPFADMSPSGDAEYLSDGITEELIHALGQVEGLRVVARTSAFAFKGKDADVREIGDALNVGALLEGSVRKSGDQLRITVQLVDARNGYHLWSRTYDRRMADVFAVQEEISRAVVRTLHPALLRSSPAPLVSASTENTAAYQLYMQGRYLWNQRTEEGLRKAIERFEQAIRLDPGYALAYSGLSDAHNALADNGYGPAEPALTKAEVAVRTALKLDPGLPEAYTSLGHLQLHRWDWTGAEQAFRRSIELNPGYAPAYQWYAYLLTFHGRFDEALPLIRRAQYLDPLSPAIQSNTGDVLLLARRYPAAVEQLRFALQMDSTRQGTRVLLAAALTEMGRYEEAIAELQRVIAMSGGWHRSAVSALGYAYARAGRWAEAEQVRREIERARRDGRNLTPYHYAGFLSALGRRDEAFAMLNEAFETQASGLVTVAISPAMDPLRSDPRFPQFLRRVGLPAWLPRVAASPEKLSRQHLARAALRYPAFAPYTAHHIS